MTCGPRSRTNVPGGGVNAHGINQDHVLGIRYQTEKRESERTTVLQPDIWRDAVIALYAGNRRCAHSVVTKQDIAKAQDENANLLSGYSLRRTVAHEASSFFLGTNL